MTKVILFAAVFAVTACQMPFRSAEASENDFNYAICQPIFEAYDKVLSASIKTGLGMHGEKGLASKGLEDAYMECADARAKVVDLDRIVVCPNLPDSHTINVVRRNKKMSYFEQKSIGTKLYDKKNQIYGPRWRKIKQIPNDQFRFDGSYGPVYYRDVECHEPHGE